MSDAPAEAALANGLDEEDVERPIVGDSPVVGADEEDAEGLAGREAKAATATRPITITTTAPPAPIRIHGHRLAVGGATCTVGAVCKTVELAASKACVQVGHSTTVPKTSSGAEMCCPQ